MAGSLEEDGMTISQDVAFFVPIYIASVILAPFVTQGREKRRERK
jgi:hypothetical protein